MEKKKNKTFTNEELSKKFKSNFDLVNYAIQLAENMIKTGRDTRVRSEIQNRAMLILEEISEGKDQFDEIQESGSSRADGVNLGTTVEKLNAESVEKLKYRTADIHDDE